MKKIILGSICLLALCAGAARADLIDPEAAKQLETLKNLPKEQRLKQCKELSPFEMADKYLWKALGCSELFKEEAAKKDPSSVNSQEKAPQAAPNTRTKTASNVRPKMGSAVRAQAPAERAQIASNGPLPTAPGTTEDKHDMRDYGLAGMLVLLLSGSAFVLLWRSRKPNLPRAL